VPTHVRGRDKIAPQNIPLNIDPDDPDVARNLVLHMREMLRRYNNHEERIRDLENVVNE